MSEGMKMTRMWDIWQLPFNPPFNFLGVVSHLFLQLKLNEREQTDQTIDLLVSEQASEKERRSIIVLTDIWYAWLLGVWPSLSRALIKLEAYANKPWTSF